MKLIVLIAISGLLYSCAKFHKVTVRTNAEGHQIPHFENINLRPIRDNNFNLITDRKKAEKRLDDLGSFDHLEKYTPKKCKIGIIESKKYHKAQMLLQNNKVVDAIELLDEVKSKCKDIVFVSHINYLYAYAYNKQGKKELAKKHTQLFIHKAESIYPISFYQYDSPNEQVKEYELYLSQAKAFLSGEDFLLNTESSPKYNTLEGTLLPGLKASDKARYLWDMGYSSISGGLFGFGYIFQSEFGEVIPFYRVTSRLGSYKSLLFRRQQYQSEDRRHTTGITVSIDEWKRFTYYKNGYNQITDVDINDTGYGLTASYGGTFQLDNDFSYVYKASITANYTSSVFGTSMISYHTGGPSSLLAGLFNDSSVIMWKVGALQIWKNFSDNSINSSLTAGIRF
jgi:hypothetical protein